MLIICNNPNKYLAEMDEGHQVVWYAALNTGAAWMIAKHPEYGFKHHRELYDTQRGPCTILGYGPSRVKFDRAKFPGPVFAINRSVELCPDAEYWCCHESEPITTHAPLRPTGSTVLTQGCSAENLAFLAAVKGMEVYLIDAEATPTRWPGATAPLYWNETTFGWTLHLAIRMGFDRINTIGIDLSLGGYLHPWMDKEELERQHVGVRERTIAMFGPEERVKWYDSPARIVDYSGGLLPVEKATL